MPIIEIPLSVDAFQFRLEESGILAREVSEEFLSYDRKFTSGQSLAQEMVSHRLLTQFQAEEILQGRGKSLVLGNYLLLAKIGSGGMGQVFKAKHKQMDRIVAVKLLPPDVNQDAAAIQRFSQEVKAAAKLTHPNKNLGEKVNDAGRQSLARFVGDSSHLLFAANGNLNFAKADRDGNWNIVTSIPNSFKFLLAWPSQDSRVLYFEQDLEGGYGKLDIWVTRRVLKNASP